MKWCDVLDTWCGDIDVIDMEEAGCAGDCLYCDHCKEDA